MKGSYEQHTRSFATLPDWKIGQLDILSLEKEH
jgi:hypothetical protein